MKRRDAFIYDFLLVEGGAEALSLDVARRFNQFDLLVGFIDPQRFPPHILEGVTCKALIGPSRLRGWQGLKTMHAFERRGQCLEAYDTAVFSGVYAPVGVHHRAGQRNLYYCHTPPRFAYDLEAHYLDQARPWQRPALRWLARHVRHRYERAVAAMDRIAVNSANVGRRLERYLGLANTEIIHPPVDTKSFAWRSGQGYFLSTARLEPYKRIDLLIDAFRGLPRQTLVIASGGSQAPALKRMARDCDNIHFTGWQSRDDLRERIGNCRATLYIPTDEDFGMSPVESMAAGKPVIGVAEGGLLETVVDGATGTLVRPERLSTDRATAVAALRAAINEMTADRARAMRAACEVRAERFSVAAFDSAFRAFTAP
ncbi:glycosyltransferase family 4 protein [Marinihelvus fidelis]|uniref:Glycosyltransferase family 4 protein n=1 Tax=Marinihelvus fidelis TaxID=2613842 RepID=A0A5N0TEA4_9GAMM|nr:glycosyltransferase [Marinihelvus fidelis]KAA9133365.1 glycosyltransferase family 4 protein [Marinihelvus fidelis]